MTLLKKVKKLFHATTKDVTVILVVIIATII